FRAAANRSDAERPRVDSLLGGVEAFALEQRVMQRLPLEAVAGKGELAAEDVDVELDRFRKVVDRDAAMMEALQRRSKSRLAHADFSSSSTNRCMNASLTPGCFAVIRLPSTTTSAVPSPS